MSEKKPEKPVKYCSFYNNAEPVFDPIMKTVRFCVYNPKDGSYTFQDHLEDAGYIIKPNPILKKYAEEGFAFLPSKPEEYGDIFKLEDEIDKFLYKYVDYPDDYRRFDVWYSFFTWIYDKASVLPYRSAMSYTPGCGKSRWIKVLGSICRLAFIQGAATSAAAVFRLSDVFRGTQIIDENYFNLKTDVGQAIIAILNSGYDRTMGMVTRCVGDSNIPTPFVTFGPKLIARRFPFPDDATEQRTITHYAYEATRNVPLHLKEEFWRESLTLRNKLLLWRFENLTTKFTEDDEFLSLKINPRLKEVLLPIVQVAQDKEVRKWLRDLALKLNEVIVDVRSESPQAGALSAIFALIKEGRKPEELQVGLIAEKFKELNPDYPVPVTARAMGSILRKELGLTVKRMSIGKRVPYVVVWDENQMRKLAEAYGLEEEFKEALTSLISNKPAERKDGLTSLTFLTSLTSSKPEVEEGKHTPSNVIEVKNVKEVICRWLDKASAHGSREVSVNAFMTELSKLTGNHTEQMKAIVRTLYREGVIKPSKDYKTVSYNPNRDLERMFEELTSESA
jgi:hypothetical protein